MQVRNTGRGKGQEEMTGHDSRMDKRRGIHVGEDEAEAVGKKQDSVVTATLLP